MRLNSLQQRSAQPRRAAMTEEEVRLVSDRIRIQIAKRAMKLEEEEKSLHSDLDMFSPITEFSTQMEVFI